MPDQNTALELSSQQERTPQQMIQVAFEAAIQQGGALDILNKILDHQKWMIQHDEEEAFNAALKRIQRQLKVIPKRGHNRQTDSKYATAEDIDSAIQALLDAEGMTLNFRPSASGNAEEVVIVGVLALGAYSKEYPLPVPADGKGAKGGGVMTRTHATGSAITYGKRYLKNMIFDLRFSEKDDDGNGAGGKVPEHDFVAMCDDIANAGSKEIGRIFQGAYEHARSVGDKDTMIALVDLKDKRVRELRGQA